MWPQSCDEANGLYFLRNEFAAQFYNDDNSFPPCIDAPASRRLANSETTMNRRVATRTEGDQVFFRIRS